MKRFTVDELYEKASATLDVWSENNMSRRDMVIAVAIMRDCLTYMQIDVEIEERTGA